jgi:hypothetical protein
MSKYILSFIAEQKDMLKEILGISLENITNSALIFFI